MQRLLVVEDEPAIRESLVDFFVGRGFLVDQTDTVAAAERALEQQGWQPGLFEDTTAFRGRIPVWPIPEVSTVPLTFQRDGLVALRPLFLDLEDDVPPEGATLRVEVSPPTEVWVRVLTSWAPVEGTGERHWPLGAPHVVVVPEAEGETP